MKLKSGLLALLMIFICTLFAQSDRQFINLSDSKDFRGMQILDSALQEKRLMVIGINRYYPEITRTVSVKFVSYARKKAGYRYLLAPVSPICGEWLNRLVYQNDYSVLQDLSLTMTEQDILFYKRLNTLNEGVEDSLKFHIIGIDAENKAIEPALEIYKLLKDKNPPDRLRIPIEALQGAVRYQQIKNDTLKSKNSESGFSVKNTLIAFSRGFDTLQSAYQSWLGDSEWFRMESLMHSLKSAIRFDVYKNTSLEDPFRVQQISNNILNNLRSSPKARFIAIIGRCYASQKWLQGTCDLYNFSPVCSKLREDSMAENRFFNVGVYYNDPSDTRDEPKEIKSQIEDIRTGIPVNSTSLKAIENKGLQYPFNFMLVMGGNSIIKSSLPKNMNSQLSAQKATVPVLSAGLNSGVHAVDIFTLNELIKAYGLPKIGIIADYGFHISRRAEERFLYEAGFYQRAKTPGSAYHYWGTYLSMASDVFSAGPWFKASVVSSLSYQKHYINKPNNSNDTAFLTRYTMPTTAVNPVFAVCLGAKGLITFSRFYLSAEAGYGWDISNARWRVNNQYSGPIDKFRGNQIFVNATAGFHLITQSKNSRKANP